MDSILHFLFSARLFFSLLLEVISITVKLSIGSVTFLTAAVFTALIIVGTLFSPPSTPPTEIVEKIDRQSAETQISYWESLVAVSPTRDAFLNLEKLYRYIEDEEMARNYRERAFELDPNNEEFANDVFTLESTNQEAIEKNVVMPNTSAIASSSATNSVLKPVVTPPLSVQ